MSDEKILRLSVDEIKMLVNAILFPAEPGRILRAAAEQYKDIAKNTKRHSAWTLCPKMASVIREP